MLKVDWDAIFKKTSHEFTEEEIDAACDGWNCCPGGSVSEFIERKSDDEEDDDFNKPVDKILDELGQQIAKCIKEQDFDAAKDIYTLIQHREGQLLAKVLKENKARIAKIDAERGQLDWDNKEIENLLK